MKTPSEREYWKLVWNKFRNGDHSAFETIYAEYIDKLFAYGSKLTIDKHLLEDSIHDLFIDIYTYKINLRKPESLEFYLLKSLKRTIYRKLKENERFEQADSLNEKFDLKFSIEEQNIEFSNDKIKSLQKEVQNLSAKQRELIYLKFNTGLTYVEMGKLLHLKPDTVKKQVYRLLKHIRGKIEKISLELFAFCFKS